MYVHVGKIIVLYYTLLPKPHPSHVYKLIIDYLNSKELFAMPHYTVNILQS